jgi:hypothetical protein
MRTVVSAALLALVWSYLSLGTALGAALVLTALAPFAIAGAVCYGAARAIPPAARTLALVLSVWTALALALAVATYRALVHRAPLADGIIGAAQGALDALWIPALPVPAIPPAAQALLRTSPAPVALLSPAALDPLPGTEDAWDAILSSLSLPVAIPAPTVPATALFPASPAPGALSPAEALRIDMANDQAGDPVPAPAEALPESRPEALSADYWRAVAEAAAGTMIAEVFPSPAPGALSPAEALRIDMANDRAGDPVPAPAEALCIRHGRPGKDSRRGTAVRYVYRPLSGDPVPGAVYYVRRGRRYVPWTCPLPSAV